MGIETWQNPQDVWMIQEIMWETKPDFVVEAGAYKGGSAALWAMMLSQINPAGRVISIDITDRFADARKLDIVQKHVDFLVGSSTDPMIVADVAERTRGKKVFLILDSLHRKEHVLDELNNYWKMIPVGGYILVQDTNINGHPVWPTVGPGPMEAVREFLSTNKHFQIDKSRERLLLTMHPDGWLKRVN
jgi:cephalosporin hydroxylase